MRTLIMTLEFDIHEEADTVEADAGDIAEAIFLGMDPGLETGEHRLTGSAWKAPESVHHEAADYLDAKEDARLAQPSPAVAKVDTDEALALIQAARDKGIAQDAGT